MSMSNVLGRRAWFSKSADPTDRRLTLILIPFLIVALLQWLISQSSVIQGDLSMKKELISAHSVITVGLLLGAILGWSRFVVYLLLGAFGLLLSQFVLVRSVPISIAFPAAMHYVVLAYLTLGIRMSAVVGLFYLSMMCAQMLSGVDLSVWTDSSYKGALLNGLLSTLLLIYQVLRWGETVPETKPVSVEWKNPTLKKLWATLGAYWSQMRRVVALPPHVSAGPAHVQAARLHPLLLVSILNHALLLIVGMSTQSSVLGAGPIQLLCLAVLLVLLAFEWAGDVSLAVWGWVAYVCVFIVLLGVTVGVVHPATLTLWMPLTLGIILVTSLARGVMISGVVLGVLMLIVVSTGQKEGTLSVMRFASTELWMWAVCIFNLLFVVIHTHYRVIQRMMKERRSVEVNYQQVLALSPVGVLVMNEEGAVLLANGAAQKVLGDSDPKAATLVSGAHELATRVPRLMSGVRTCMAQQDVHVFETQLTPAAGGETVYLRVHCSPLNHKDRQASTCQVMLVNLTELRSKERELRQQLNEREQRLRNLNHRILRDLQTHHTGLRTIEMSAGPEAFEQSLAEIGTVMKDIRLMIAGRL